MRLFVSSVAACSALVAGVSWGLQQPSQPQPQITDDAIVIRDFSNGLADEFAFHRTISAILASGKVPDTAANRTALVRTMLATFNVQTMANPISGLSMPVAQRPLEAALDPSALLDPNHPNGLIPIGLFNRLDLAPADWSDCGEHRIVYATKPNAPARRLLLIFEAKLPNLDKSKGMEGCAPVAKLWQKVGISTPQARVADLKKLYFEGLPDAAGTPQPVVQHLNYGGFLGQVRANLFVGSTTWQLREYRILGVAPQKLAFSPAPVGSNPWAEFYADSTASTSALEMAERKRFQDAFLATYASALTGFDQAAPTMSEADYKEGLFNCMGAPIEVADNEFQSISQGNEDKPSTLVGPAFGAKIPLLWTSPTGSRTVQRAELLNRAGAITCGGCHQTSSEAPVGKLGGTQLSWPRPKAGPTGNFFFVHISEETEAGGRHIISDTLQNVFIPHRKKVLMSILKGESPARHCAVSQPPSALLSAAAAQSFPTRAEVERAARKLLEAAPSQAAASTAAADELRRFSDAAHSADARMPGAVATFRRPH